MKKFKSFYVTAFMLYMILLFMYGCKNYYMAVKAPTTNTEVKTDAVSKLQAENRYFILRSGDMYYHMKNMVVNEDKKTMNVILDSVSEDQRLYINEGHKKKKTYIKAGEAQQKNVLNEVHIYIDSENTLQTGAYKLDLEKVNKIEIIEKDQKKTTNSYVITGLTVTVGVLALAVIIALATKSSCPFVSAYDGNDFTLQGEIYGGAIYPQLARHDYLPLQMKPFEDGSLQLKITNELKERQFTDLADLWIITHDKNAEIWADEKGNLHSITKPESPVKVLLNNKTDFTQALKLAGDNQMILMDDTATIHSGNEVYMQFNKPASATNGKLKLCLKNSYFLDLLYGELAMGLGSYYNTYVKQQKKKPAEDLMKWTREQQIPLLVSVKTANGWKIVSEIITVGPLSTRNMIVPIDVPAGEEFTEIKLNSGFMFWEIDQASIEYHSNIDFTIEKIKPVSATDEKGNNVLASLLQEDGVYLDQPEIGNAATLVYKPQSLTDPSNTRSYILHAKGYYEHIRDFKNKPDIAFLKQFKNPGAFPAYGLDLYKKILQKQMQSIASKN